jgi:3-oxoacyl-[acyl-carrier-protein] synthase-3
VTALEAVATYLPDQRVPIENLASQLGLTPMQIKLFKRFHGLAEVHRDPGGTLLDLLLAAATRLDALRGREHQVAYVLHARRHGA